MLFGSCGLDKEGDIALSSLQKCNVNTDLIVREEIPTSIMNVIIPYKDNQGDNDVIHTWYSPITNKRTLFFRENLPVTLPHELLEKEVYVTTDKFELVNFEFINNIPNKKVCLDIGHVRFIEHFTKQYLTKFFQTANLVQINQNVISLIFERLKVKNELELFDLLDLELMVITKGKKGATFIFRQENGELKSVDKSPDIIAESVDSTGAGDAFFSTVIKKYAYCDKIDLNFIDEVFSSANKSSREVISQLGSRRTK